MVNVTQDINLLRKVCGFDTLEAKLVKFVLGM